MSDGTSRIPPGWYHDPTGRAEMRYWAGTAWSAWVLRDGETVVDPRPVRRPLGYGDLGALEFVAGVFLPEAAALGVVTDEEVDRLRSVVTSLGDEVRHGPAWQAGEAGAGTAGE